MTEAPAQRLVIKNPTVIPAKLARFLGGPVTVSAQVKSASPVDSVTAHIMRQSDGQTLPDVPLRRQGSTSTYQATIVAPANMRSDGQSETFAVTIVAIRGGQRDQKSAGTFEAPAPPTAPGLPPIP